jgi:DNA modification methylase
MNPYYEDDAVTIYHGDMLEVLPSLTDDIGGIVTDTPYGVGYDYGGEYVDIKGDAYWEQFARWLAAMRAAAPSVVFTHRLAALKVLTDWDWVSVWNKPLAMSGLNALPVMPHWEPIFMYGVKCRPELPRRYDVISVNPANASTSDHPCPKPVPLMRQLIEWTVPTGVVVDPFAGSGATLRAAKDINRKSIGIEQSERFCEIAARTVSQEVMDFGGAA